MYTIVELDGVFANNKWRIPTINKDCQDPVKKWGVYNNLCDRDLFINREILDDIISLGEKLIINTTRSISTREKTIVWLSKHGIEFSHIMMRNEGDNRPPSMVKETNLLKLLRRGLASFKDISCCYDNDPKSQKMYQEFGFKVYTTYNISDKE
jgi:hypothetical protein